jgi:hypothetical protein
MPSRWARAWLALLTLALVAAPDPAAAGSPAISLSPRSHQPTVKVDIGGTGFGPTEMVDVSFDEEVVTTEVTDGDGIFSGT